MPKVTRAPARKIARGSAAGRSGSRRSSRRAPAPSFLTQLRNRISARLRAAHYRASAAIRLVSIAAIVLAAAGVFILSGLGRLDAAGQYTGGVAQDALRKIGFRLERVDVAGLDAAPFEEVRAALGLEYGESIFALDLEAARQRVEALDWVGEAQVFRLLPNRVQVVVAEQVPLARWQIDGTIVVIDETGQPIEQAGPTDFAQLPLVVGEGAAEPAPALLAALAGFPDVAAHVEAAQRVGERRWTLYLDNGAQLLLPEDDDRAALAVVSRLQAERNLLNAPAELIDLRNPDQMVIRGQLAPADEASPGLNPGAARAYGPGREA